MLGVVAALTDAAGRTVTLNPLRRQANAMEIMVLVLSMWTSVRDTVLDRDPSSVGQLLGPGWAAVWAVTLLAGPLVVLTGLGWPGRALTGISLQQLGYATFTVASLARASALVGVGYPIQSVTVWAFAAFSAVQVVLLQLAVARWVPRARRRSAVLRRLGARALRCRRG